MRDLVEWNSRGETQETEREWKKKKTRMSFTAKERAALLRGAAVMGWTQFTFIITQLTLGYGGMTTHLINVPLLIRRACSRFSHWQLRDCFFFVLLLLPSEELLYATNKGTPPQCLRWEQWNKWIELCQMWKISLSLPGAWGWSVWICFQAQSTQM